MLSRSLNMGKKIEKLCAARTQPMYRDPPSPSMGKRACNRTRCVPKPATLRLLASVSMRIYTASQVFRVHVELTTRCNAACPMCPRTRAGGEPNPNLPLTELTLSDFQTMFPPSLLRRLKQFLFCGNYGDALTARDTLPICEYLRR